MKVYVFKDRQYAPLSYLVVKEKGNPYLVSDTVLIQLDYDFPSLASNLGFQTCHNETDGSVNCPICGKTASQFISEAREWLDSHLGIMFDDPGYFES